MLAAAACGSDAIAPRPPSSLDGPWSSGHSVIGLNVALELTWTADSVKGTGSYAFVPTDTPFGCGGGTLPAHGTVSFAAGRAASGQIGGAFRFDNGWIPPYGGTLTADSSRIDGAFRSIDAGSCPFTMFHGLVP